MAQGHWRTANEDAAPFASNDPSVHHRKKSLVEVFLAPSEDGGSFTKALPENAMRSVALSVLALLWLVAAAASLNAADPATVAFTKRWPQCNIPSGLQAARRRPAGRRSPRCAGAVERNQCHSAMVRRRATPQDSLGVRPADEPISNSGLGDA